MEGWGYSIFRCGGLLYPTYRRGRFKMLGLQRELPVSKVPPLVENPDLPIKKTLRRKLGLLTVMILKRVTENIFF